MLSRKCLHEYQRRAVDFIIEKKRSALFLDMGLGKTTTSLTAATDLLDACAVARVLIIAPLRVANSVWAQEAKQWEHTQHLRVSVCTGTEKKRIAALHQTADIYVINRENVPWLVKHYGKKWPFDCVIIDESSSFKSPGSQRFKALKKIVPHTEYLWLLTGTPSPNGLLDLWSQMYLVDFGERLSRTMTNYKQRFFEQDYTGYNWTPREGSNATIHALIADKVMSMSAADYLDVPDRVDIVERVELPAKLLREYQQFEKTMLAELDNGTEVEAISAAALANKLLQFCIAEGTPVVTDRGLIPIEEVRESDKIWDGAKWVNCSGVVFKGCDYVLNCYGVYMTAEHKVLTRCGWKTAKAILDGEPDERPCREYLRNPYRITQDWIEERKGHLAVPMRLWEHRGAPEPKLTQRPPKQSSKIMWLFASQVVENSRDERNEADYNLAKYDRQVPRPERQGLQKLRCSRHIRLRELATFIRNLLAGHAGRLFGQVELGSNRQRQRLRKEQLPLGNGKTAGQEYTEFDHNMDAERSNEPFRSRRTFRHKGRDITCSNIPLSTAERKVVHKTKVYDLVSCGPDNRFTVVGADGSPVIVHNCNGATYIDDKGSWHELHSAKLDALADIVEQNPSETMLVAYNYKSDLARLQKRFPDAVVLGKDQSVIDDWNAGKIPMLLAHPASAGHGLNLQAGGSMIVWFGLNWSLELYQQFNARLHRQGQTKPVRVVHLVANGCIDERVMSVIESKDHTQLALLNALKQPIAN